MKTLTVSEAAAALGKRPETIRRWIGAGKLASTREGAHVLIPASALATFKARPCAQCGQSFTPARPTRGGRFCSLKCQWAAGNEKRKTGKPKGRPKRQRAVIPAPERLKAAIRYARTVLRPA